MNQIQVPIPGRSNEKLVFVKDVSHFSNLKKLLATNISMATFKDEMMLMLDAYAKNAQKILRSLDPQVSLFGKETLYDCEA
jgi:hypothetical protein